MTSQTILLLGGGGYVGSVLTQILLDLNYTVKCIDALVYKNHAGPESFLGNPNYEFINHEISEFDQLDGVCEGVDHVVILAGLVGDPITKKYPEESKCINETGIQNTFELLNNQSVKKVIFISTCSNYGLMPDGVLANEDSELNPLSLYAKAKVSAEKKLMSLQGMVDYCPTVLRFATAFGLSPRMRFDLTVNEFTRELALGNELLVFDPDTWRPYCHLQDFARLILKVLNSDSSKVAFEVFNAGGDANNFTKRMLIEEIQRSIPNAQVKYKEDGGDPRNYRVDFSKVKEVLKFEPQLSVSDGIKELILAINNGFFRDLKGREDHFGNYKLYK